MSNGRRRRRRFADTPKYPSSAFGGWGDYRTWAEHQFLPKPAEAEADDGGTRDGGTRDAGAREDDTWGDGARGDGARGDETRGDDTWDAGAAVVDSGRDGTYGDPGAPGAGDHRAGISPDAAPRAGPAPVAGPGAGPAWGTDPGTGPAPVAGSGPGLVPVAGPGAAPVPVTGPDREAPNLVRYEQDPRPVGPRPYVLARGRTGGDGLPRMDSLITVTPEGALSADNPALPPEYRRICDMCREPMAVVEIAGRLRVPIGVAAVLVGDAIGWNLLRAHTSAETDDRPSIGVITRVHEGLLRLR
ncbi:DUF742 domain-containing protein [Streptosporangium sp. NPDC048865]|uniref:DUF742 domain-containing protein n=1 Tax=Streptosporangium sp. NPDC048865 TaxID=3155766 RepID=UPI00341E1D95